MSVIDVNSTTKLVELPRPARLLIPASEVVSNLREPEMVVAGMLERDTIASLVGQWGGGKTAVALDIAMRCATGLPVHGRAVRQGLCVYVCGEGHAGFGRRLTAWSAHNRTDLRDVPLYLTQSAVPMPDPTGPAALQAEIEGIAERLGLEPQIIVIDTLARNLNGDENSSADMGAFVQSLDTYLRRPFSACVLVLHHPGHGDKGRGRGASAFPAAVDVEYLLERTGDDLRMSTSKPAKDFESPDPMCWRLTPIPLLINDTPASGITVSEVASEDAPARQERATKITAASKVALEALHAVLDVSHRTAGPDEMKAGAKVGQIIADFEAWRAECYARRIADGESDALRVAFNRAKNELQSKRRIGIREEAVWLA